VAVRLKVLTEEGKDLALVEIYHGRYVQLEQITARTISPDGLVTPVPSSATFRQRLSDRGRYYLTRLAFPKSAGSKTSSAASASARSGTPPPARGRRRS
jgi:hypothetical protein